MVNETPKMCDEIKALNILGINVSSGEKKN